MDESLSKSVHWKPFRFQLFSDEVNSRCGRPKLLAIRQASSHQGRRAPQLPVPSDRACAFLRDNQIAIASTPNADIKLEMNPEGPDPAKPLRPVPQGPCDPFHRLVVEGTYPTCRFAFPKIRIIGPCTRRRLERPEPLHFVKTSFWFELQPGFQRSHT